MILGTVVQWVKRFLLRNGYWLSCLLVLRIPTLTSVCWKHSVVIVLKTNYVPPQTQLEKLSFAREGVNLSTGKIFKSVLTIFSI